MGATMTPTTSVVTLLVAMTTVVTMVTSSRVVTMSSCHAMLDGALISLEPLQRSDGFPRYSVGYGGWNFTFNPCAPYNEPFDPHTGTGDQCHNVAMCKSRNTSVGGEEYYTMGIQSSARMMLKRVPTGSEELELDDSSSEELPGEESSSEEGEETSEEDDDEEDEDEEGEEDSEEEIEEEESEDDEEESSNNVTVSLLDIITNTPLPEPGRNRSNNDPNAIDVGSEEVDSGAPARDGSDNLTAATMATNDDPPDLNIAVRESRHLRTDLLPNSQRDERVGRRAGRSRDRKRSRQRTRESSRVRRKISEEEGEFVGGKSNMAEEDVPRRRNKVRELEEDDEHGVPRLVIRFKGTRSQRAYRSYVVLSCAPELNEVDSGQFSLLSANQKELFFELRHHCCCPEACVTPPEGHPIAAKRLTDMDDGAQHLWMVVVVNFFIIVLATIIGLVCCRKGGGSGPYNMLPALHSSRTTLTSVESLRYQKKKFYNRPPDFLEYSSSLHQKAQLPLLANCIVHSREVDIGHRMGGGLFGDSYIGEWKDRRVAIKRFTVGVHQNQISEDDVDWLAKEVGYLTRHRHKHLVTVLAICLDTRQPHVINEYVDGGCVKDVLKQNSIAFSMAQKLKMCVQAAEGMAYLHSLKRPILHRDLRCANLLLDKDEKIKIADFGITKLLQRLRQQCTGHEGCYCQKHQSALPASIRWTAPEILQHPNAEEGRGSVFTGACDVYSFGMLMWEMTTGLDPYEGIKDESKLVELVLQGARPDLEVLGSMGASAHFRELIRVCWEEDPGTRPLFKHVIMHLKTALQNLNKTERTLSAMNDTNSYLKSALSVYKDLT